MPVGLSDQERAVRNTIRHEPTVFTRGAGSRLVMTGLQLFAPISDRQCSMSATS